jgi:[ribosomal protein S18]-alanine N-acetyltransferase
MERRAVTPERKPASLTRATEKDIAKLIAIEKSVEGNKYYSPMLTEDEWIKELKTHDVFLVKLGGKVVGNVSYERKSPQHVYISGLVVLPAYQGQGIAREVMTKVLAELGDIERIDLVTHPGNPALNLYTSLGFVEEALHENYYGDGEPRLVLVLRRE